VRPDIKAVALDVDGVLTDGSFWWGGDGPELKRFSFRDVMGVSLASRQGMIFALISGEQSPLIDRYANKMHITDIYQGCRDKESALRAFAESRKLDLASICFMGDDVNDLGAMKIAGLSASPANGHESVLAAAGFVAKSNGGCGAVRELLDFITR
jgi:3-deoxy-D-manno-octulosonate 8-phosphate phosphatase (KDO 8-P phosphatase)